VLMGSSLLNPSRKIPYVTHHIFLLDRKRRVERRDGYVLLTTGSTARFSLCVIFATTVVRHGCVLVTTGFLTGVEYAFS
jgi:hypothetical protein